MNEHQVEIEINFRFTDQFLFSFFEYVFFHFDVKFNKFSLRKFNSFITVWLTSFVIENNFGQINKVLNEKKANISDYFCVFFS